MRPQVYSNIKKFREDLEQYPPHFFVCVPLVLDTLHSRVMQTLKRGSQVKRRLATFLLAVSGAFVRARRVVQGVALQYARSPRPALAWLWAAATAALLWPLHRCALCETRAPTCAQGRKLETQHEIVAICSAPAQHHRWPPSAGEAPVSWAGMRLAPDSLLAPPSRLQAGRGAGVRQGARGAGHQAGRHQRRRQPGPPPGRLLREHWPARHQRLGLDGALPEGPGPEWSCLNVA